MRSRLMLVLTIAMSLLFSSCAALRSFNLFNPDQDIELGKQVSEEIRNNPAEFPLLPEKGNEQVYAYIRGLKDKILQSDKIQYRDKFAWEVHIVKNDTVLNAFATPGGYIYVYTGLIKFLDSEDQLIGVLGHEIAHSDRRHSTSQLSKVMGLSVLSNAALGQQQALQQIITGLTSLSFSRAHESEADEYSVNYLCPTEYNAKGAAGFFEKMKAQPSPPEFLSTHPDPKNRVQDIQKKATQLNCTGTQVFEDRYRQIKALL